MLQILMAIIVVYSTCGVTSDKKKSSLAQNGGHFENVKNIKHRFNLTSEMKRSSQSMQEKIFS